MYVSETDQIANELRTVGEARAVLLVALEKLQEGTELVGEYYAAYTAAGNAAAAASLLENVGAFCGRVRASLEGRGNDDILTELERNKVKLALAQAFDAVQTIAAQIGNQLGYVDGFLGALRSITRSVVEQVAAAVMPLWPVWLLAGLALVVVLVSKVRAAS